MLSEQTNTDDEDINQNNKATLDNSCRVFTDRRVTSVKELKSEVSKTWTSADEEEYMERIREKATQKAYEIVAEAEGKAGDILKKAREEGYSEGKKQGQAEALAVSDSLSEAVASTLDAIQGQSGNIFNAWKDDLVALLKLSVQKTIGIALDGSKDQVLEKLYSDAVKAMDDARNLNIRVNPEDEARVTSVITMANENFPTVKAWKVTSDSSITQGGMIIESSYSLADNTIESRLKAVTDVIEQLQLPSN